MNTPAHLIIGLAAFDRPEKRGTALGALLGSLAPDLSLYLMVGWAINVSGYSPQVVFDQLYYSSEWQAVFAVDNSLILWGILLAFALWSERAALTAFAGAGCLHILLDLPLHTHDARMHFWPATDWVFHSPFSYWDPAAHGQLFGAIELLLCVALLLLLWQRWQSPRARWGIAALALAEFLSGGLFWVFML